MFIKINVYQFIKSRDPHKKGKRPTCGSRPPVWEPLL